MFTTQMDGLSVMHVYIHSRMRKLKMTFLFMWHICTHEREECIHWAGEHYTHIYGKGKGFWIYTDIYKNRKVTWIHANTREIKGQLSRYVCTWLVYIYITWMSSLHACTHGGMDRLSIKMNISRGRNRSFVYKCVYIQRGRWIIYIHKGEYWGRMDGQIISIQTRAREDSILSAEYAIFHSL